MRNLLNCACVVLLIGGACLTVGAAFEQSQTTGPQGRLAGLVLDPGKARVPRAKIVLEAKEFKREIVSADDGSYSVDVPEGKYRIRVERDGFYPFRKNDVRIVSGGLLRLDIVIKGIRNDETHP